jgi:hypothetical protein
LGKANMPISSAISELSVRTSQWPESTAYS